MSPGAPVVVIGAGPGGLAAATQLKRSGLTAVVLERGQHLGTSWRSHYDHLRLHTTRGLSKLPGLPLPRRHGPWVARDEMVHYLERYVRHHDLDIRLGTPVLGLRALEPAGPVGAAAPVWRVHTEHGTFDARAVVVATGRNHTPFLPLWPGRSKYRGVVLHSSEYRTPSEYRDRSVLVVGAGNSGTEIAVALAQGGAGRVWLSVRTAPHIMPLSSVEAVRTGQVLPVPAVEALDGDEAVLADGSKVAPDVLLAATGYLSGLEKLVGHLPVLDAKGYPLVHGARTHPKAPRLFFAGYRNPPTGALHELTREDELSREARQIARAIRQGGIPRRGA